MDKSEVTNGQFFKTHGDAPVFLDLQEEIFDQCALFIMCPIDMPGIALVGFGRNAETDSIRTKSSLLGMGSNYLLSGRFLYGLALLRYG